MLLDPLPIISSEVVYDTRQPDGRRYIREIHRDSGGHEFIYDYLARELDDTKLMVLEHAKTLPQYLYNGAVPPMLSPALELPPKPRGRR